MTSGSDATNLPSDDDFRRLGIRLREARMPVIRSAAMRSSSALADQQLASPADHLQLQLSRVAISTYRILNPRLRSDFLQRISLGRVSPEALFAQSAPDFGGQPFAPRSLQDSGTEEGDTESPGVVLVGDEFLTKISSLDHSPIAKSGERAWADSLADHDLRVRPSRSQRVLKKLHSQRKWLITGALVFIGLVLVASRVFRDNGSTELAETRVTDSVQPASLDPASPPSSKLPPAESTTSQNPTASIASEQPPPADDAVSGSFAPNRPTPPAVSIETNLPTSALPVKPVEMEPASETPVVSAAATPVTELDQGLAQPLASVPNNPQPLRPDLILNPDTTDNVNASTEMTAAGESGFLDDPFNLNSSAAPVPADEDTSNVADASMETPTANSHADPADKFSPPDAIELVASRRRVRASASRANGAVSEPQAISAVQRLVEFAHNQQPGSIDHYAGLLVSVEDAWLAPESCYLGSRVDEICETYQIDHTTVAVETLIRTLDETSTPESQQSLFWSGCWLVDHCLVNERPELSARLLRQLTATAKALGNDATNEQVKSLTSDATLADRFSQQAQSNATSAPDQTTPAVAGIVGRYHCLVRRDWDKGLAWMASGSAVQLASVSELEIELALAPDAGNQIRVAARWAILAGDETGRTELAMRLHAIDLATAVARDSTASNLEKAEALKLAKTQAATLPAFMQSDLLATRRTVPTGSMLSGTQTTLTEFPVAGMPTVGAVSAMNGSLHVPPVGGTVLPLRYELGGTISADLLRQISQRLSVDLTGAQFQLSGVFQLPSPSKIRVSLPGTTSPESVITLDGNVISIDDTSPADLTAGRHVITWTLKTKSLQATQLTIVDLATNLPVVVIPERRSATNERMIVIKSSGN